MTLNLDVVNAVPGQVRIGTIQGFKGLEADVVILAGLDRKAIRDFVAGNEHSTIIGKIKFAGSENVGTPGAVSQWQKGEFEVVWPKARATAPLNPAKPAWV